MSDERRKEALKTASSNSDIIGVVLDFSHPAKIDSLVLDVKALIPSKSWELSDIKMVKQETGGKPVIIQGVMCSEDGVIAV